MLVTLNILCKVARKSITYVQLEIFYIEKHVKNAGALYLLFKTSPADCRYML